MSPKSILATLGVLAAVCLVVVAFGLSFLLSPSYRSGGVNPQ